MTVPTVTTGDPITAAWGNTVAADVNAATTQNATDGSRLTALETATKVELFSTVGTATWTKAANAREVEVYAVGGGGAGGGCVTTIASESAAGSGGGGGGCAYRVYDASTLAATETVTVGQGGTGVAGLAGNDGDPSSFATGKAYVATGNGGVGGNPSGGGTATQRVQGGLGGTATGGSANSPGQPGSPGNTIQGVPLATGNGGMSGRGFGGGGNSAAATGNGVAAAGGFGGGGGGAIQGASQATARLGGAGRQGCVLVVTRF